MNDYMVEEVYADGYFEPTWSPKFAEDVSLVASAVSSERIHHLIRGERLWGPLFVVVTFTLWGWYLFWLYCALQDLTFVPWP
jgi:hypothetical protein